MANVFDVIVIGIGAMGSAAAYHLSNQNKTVLGIDRYSPPHNMGSSHGESRIIREAYFEGEQYVPLIQHAYRNWQKLETEYGHQLYIPTGGLMLGNADSEIIKGSKYSADIHSLPYRILSAKETMKQYPALRMQKEMIGVWEPRAGILFPEKCIEAHLKIGEKNGAEFRFNEQSLSWKKEGSLICVSTSSGKYYAEQLLLTAGAWLNNFLGNATLPLTIERQILYWFQPIANIDLFDPKNFPIFIWAIDNNSNYYGFPNLGNGIKMARHHQGIATDPDFIDRAVTAEEISTMRTFLSNYIPAANGRLTATATCMYTNTSDYNFHISRHPDCAQVLIASICSGHGFKFASVIGEVLTDILVKGKSKYDLSMFGYAS